MTLNIGLSDYRIIGVGRDLRRLRWLFFYYYFLNLYEWCYS